MRRETDRVVADLDAVSSAVSVSIPAGVAAGAGLTYEVDDPDARLQVRTPDYTPLSASQRHARIVLSPGDAEVSVSLSATQAATLRDALDDALLAAGEGGEGNGSNPEE